jgi:tetratricopeptide (TPR) repeat protein
VEVTAFDGLPEAPCSSVRPSRAWASWVVLLLSLSLSLGTARALADDQQEARTTFERGVEASRSQRWEEAREQFQRSLQLVPKASTMFNLAVADIKLGLGREALEQLGAFERAATDEHGAMLERARVLRPQAQALVDSQQAAAENRGSLLSRSDDGLDDQARKDVEEARENYARGRDREALAGFERAYRSSKRPELLYNIGVVADRLRDDRRAVRAYERYVDELPDAPEAAVAQVRVEALRNALAEQKSRAAQAGPVAVAPAPERMPAPAPDLLVPRFMVVTGSVVTVASFGVLGWLVHRLGDYRECLDSVRPTDTQGSRRVCGNAAVVRDDQPKARAGAYAAASLAAVGLTMTAVGAVQLAKRKRAAKEAHGLTLLPSFALGGERGGTLSIGGRF